jgi:preprotein translocase subunit SecY
MASAAEQLAQHINFGSFAKAKELQKRILFTLIALVVYRVGTFIPIPGIDPAQFSQAFDAQRQGLLGMFNVLSGGAVERMAIFALNVMPYISASIIVQLLSSVVPSLERLKKEGEAGRKQLNQYTRYLTLALAIVQSFGIAMGLQGTGGNSVVTEPGFFFVATTVITLTGGTMFLMWVGEQITARGVGNGISLIIFAGIVAELPRALVQTLNLSANGTLDGFALLGIVLLVAAVTVLIVFVERSLRRVIIQYPKRQVGNRMFMGESTFLPLKINTAGVIPPIFASSLLMLPVTVLGFMGAGENQAEWLTSAVGALQYGQPLHILLYAVGIVFFCFFYTSIVFNPDETADNLRKYGGFVPGIRPGKNTAAYLDYVLTRLTVIGAAYITFVCILPEVVAGATGVPFQAGGTSLLIVVSVTLDTVNQIQSHLVAHQYEGLIKKTKLRGGRK